MKNLERIDLRVSDAFESPTVSQKCIRLMSVVLFYIFIMVTPSILYSQNLDGVKRASTKQEVQSIPYSQEMEDGKATQNTSSSQTPLIFKFRTVDLSLFDSPLKQFFESPEFWENYQEPQPPVIVYEHPCRRYCRERKYAELGRCFAVFDDDEDSRQTCIRLVEEYYYECSSSCLGDFMP